MYNNQKIEILKKNGISDIATALNVSKTTVSLVINGRGDEKKISRETQERILTLVKEIGYRPNFTAKSLKTGRTNTIAYLVPDISNPFFSKIGKYIEEELFKAGYFLLTCSTGEDAKKEAVMLQSFHNRQVDGMIIAPCDKSLSAEASSVPLVIFDREVEMPEKHCVLVENQQSMEQAVNFLLEAGKRKIGLCSLSPGISPLQQRIDGYHSALARFGIAPNEDWQCIVPSNNFREPLYKGIEKLVKQQVDSIVFTNNVVATEGMWVLNNYHASFLRNIRIVSFDNLELFDYSYPKIISIAQPVKDIAQNVVRLLFDSLNKPEKESERILLQPEIIIR